MGIEEIMLFREKHFISPHIYNFYLLLTKVLFMINLSPLHSQTIQK